MNSLSRKIARTALYPEMSRRSLELQYHHMAAALSFAAMEKHPGKEDAVMKQVDAWLDLSLDMATKAGVVRQMRNFKRTTPATETIQ